MKILARGFTYRLLFMVLGFAVNLLIAKLAGTSLFGSISLMIVNAALIQIITGMGTDAAIVWHGARGGKAYMQKAFTFTLLAAAAQILIFTIAAFAFLKLDGITILSNRDDIEIFFAELIYFCGLVLLEKFTSLFYSRQKAILCNAILATVTFAFIVILLAGDSTDTLQSNVNLIWFFCIMTFMQAAVLVTFYLFRFSLQLQGLSKSDIRSFVNFSMIVFFTNMIQFFAYRSDYWFIHYYHDINTVGVYAQANRFAQLLWVLPNVASSLVLPLMAVSNGSFDLKKFNLLARIILLFTAVLLFLLIPTAWVIYRNFLPRDFFAGFNTLLIMIPGFLLFSFTILLAAFFSARRMLWVNFKGSCICFIIVIAADYILIPSYGITGAGISNSVAYSVTALYFVFEFSRKTETRVFAIFNFRNNDIKKMIKSVNAD